MSAHHSTPLRRRTLLGLALGGAASAMCREPAPSTSDSPINQKPMEPKFERLPVVFVGHGSPMNAIEDNAWARAFRKLGESLPKPRAVLAVSAHWFVPGTYVTNNARPDTIHDFGGFPQALHDVVYPAPGDPVLAEHVSRLLGAHGATPRADWGLDHGTWSVLVHMRPQADTPVLQLSIDARLPASQHIAIGRALAPLRDEGVLILGSGNIVHNLRDAFTNMRQGRSETPPWAATFDGDVAKALVERDGEHLARTLESDVGRVSHPTPEHYLPLLYSFGASLENDSVDFPITGFDAGSLSMRSVRFG
jgi:4,5-DOPA dioxygenase extradiol